MANPAENQPSVPAQARGSNGQRGNAGGRPKGSRNKNSRQTNDAVQEEIARLRARVAEMEATNKSLEERAARGSTAAAAPEQEIERLHKPKGEAGDGKRGFNLRDAMGLEDDQEEFLRIQDIVRTNCRRVNLDFTQDYRKQEPEKLAALFKLSRKDSDYLTTKRFPLNWAQAEIVKQYLRNRRKYNVRKGRLPDRETRKRQAQDDGTASGSRKRRKTTSGRSSSPLPHIDDQEDEDEDGDEEGNADSDGENAGHTVEEQ
ncbi:hypothetical protein C8F04DRAFT_1243941 [Mycena alexandri]|uniref:Uncharacterized protein n=1 Tax=Mycena alexandri TaxID=1745969 RepID=A0AAD6WKU5_9AGAR|nr:hypothetical protein C8F04DRAFT_1243941 [Mycena alexandri]